LPACLLVTLAGLTRTITSSESINVKFSEIIMCRTPQSLVRAMPGALAVTIAMIAALGGARAFAQGGTGNMVVRNSTTGFAIRTSDGGQTWQRVDPEELGASRAGGVVEANAWPNPTTGTTAIRYRLEQPGSVVITVTNIAGVDVARFDVGASDKGEGAVLFNAATVPPGPYYFRVVSGGQTRNGGILLVTR
jgi:hypothetical protein